jgi:hypothetical protein
LKLSFSSTLVWIYVTYVCCYKPFIIINCVFS